MADLVQTQQLLERGRLRLSKGWIRGQMATNRLGLPVAPTSVYAERFCAVGVLRSFDNTEVRRIAMGFLDDQAYKLYGKVSVMNVNDHLGKQAALAVYDAAIKKVKLMREAELAKQVDSIKINEPERELAYAT